MRVYDNVHLSYLEPNSNESVNNRVLDISSDGAAVLLPMEHAKNYTIGCELKLLTFRIRDIKVTASATVKYLIEQPKKEICLNVVGGIKGA